MKKIIFYVIMATLSLLLILPTPVFAVCSDEQKENGCVDTSILGSDGCSCGKDQEQNNNGEGIIHIIELVIDIISTGIGIFGVIGISYAGIQYLTAGGSEEKVRTAKRRIYEIVIGLAAYAVMYAFLKWAIPNFNTKPDKIERINPSTSDPADSGGDTPAPADTPAA